MLIMPQWLRDVFGTYEALRPWVRAVVASAVIAGAFLFAGAWFGG